MRCRNIFMNVLRSTLTNDKRGLRAISCYALSLITKLWKFANGRFNASFISLIIKIHLFCCKTSEDYILYIYIYTTSNVFKFTILSHICKFSNPKRWKYQSLMYHFCNCLYNRFFILSFKSLSFNVALYFLISDFYFLIILVIIGIIIFYSNDILN